MENLSLAYVLQEIATLLEFKGENIFKVRAYEKAAKIITELPENIVTVTKEGRLGKITGIGKALESKITEFVTTGSVEYLEQLRTDVPPGLLELLDIPGVGPKMIQTFHQQLGITSLDELEAAAKAKKIRELKGLGAKTELSIVRDLERTRCGSTRVSIGVVLPISQEVKAYLQQIIGVEQVEIAGSIRRFREDTKDLDLLVASHDSVTVMDTFCTMPIVEEISVRGDTKASVVLKTGFSADLRVVTPTQFPCALHYFTGSKNHNIRMRKRAQKRGMKLSEYALTNENGEALEINSEADLFSLLGLSYIPPELREDRGEFQAAASNTLPRLISMDQIRSDLHMHTVYSDGTNRISEMAKAAQKNGLAYIGICDHSRTLTIANGMSVKRLMKQRHEIKQVSQDLGFPIMCGVECDILADGSLDYDDAVLADLDIVVASIHSGFRQEEHKLTHRVIQAIKNPHVSIIAHPTGRIIGHRQPYDIDLDAVIQAAADYGKILEINASPERLDLADQYARAAKDKGVKLAINSDAHSVEQLDYMHYGVAYAKRAWLESCDVVNTWTIQELQDYLGKCT